MDHLDDIAEGQEKATVEGKSSQDELQAWVDEHIMPKALEEATALMTDKALYGFAAKGADGKRIDAYELLPAKHKRATAPYRERASVPIGWPSNHRS